MSLSSQMIQDMAEIMADTDGPAESVTYKISGGQSIPIRAMVERLGLAEESGPGGQANINAAIIHVKVSDVSAVSFADTISIRSPAGVSEVWRVQSIRGENAAVRALEIVRVDRTRLVAQGDELEYGKNVSRKM